MSSTWTPPPNLTISEWGDQNYVLPEEHGGGKWKTKPFQVGIADAMCDPEEERVTVMKSMRVGYTKIVDLAIGYYMDADPSSMLVVQPTIDDAEGFSKDEIAPMLRDVPALKGKVSREDDTLLKKVYPGGSLTLVGANSPTGFRRLTVRIVIFDEMSAYPVNTGKDGDPVRQGEGRTFSAFNRKIIAGSTPTIAGSCRIEKEFQRSDQRYFHVPCPHCGHKHILQWSNFRWPEGKPEKAHFICPSCREPIEEIHKKSMVGSGEWRSIRPFTCCEVEQKPAKWDKKGRPICSECGKVHISGHAGFHIWAAYSDLPNAKWSKLVKYWLEVKDDPDEKVVFINTIRGETYRETEEEVDWKPLYDRREPYGDEHDGLVPEGVRIILATVDTQDNRLELTTVGVGEGEELWLLNREVFMGAPDNPETLKQLTRYLDRSYTHACGFSIGITACAIDVQGHYYDTMLAYCAQNSDRCVAIRGGNDYAAPAIKPPSRTNVWKIPLYTLGINNIKNRIAKRLRFKYPGRFFIHWPLSNQFEADYFEQLTAETVVTEYKNGIPYRVFKNPTKARNEAWDLLVYAYALLWIFNPDLSEVIGGWNEEDEEDWDDDDEYEGGWMDS